MTEPCLENTVSTESAVLDPSAQRRAPGRRQATSDGAGVKLTRVLTQPLQRRLDPFLMLDAFGTDKPDDYIAGFPDHPHRGFETVTYMIAGRMRHRDSAGHEGLLCNGGVQWMTAGRGVIHSEMPEQEEGRMEGFQLWLNLPARDKMRDAVVPRHRSGRDPELERRRRDRTRDRRREPRRAAARCSATRPSRCTWTCTWQPAPTSSSRCRPATTPSSTSTAAS